MKTFKEFIAEEFILESGSGLSQLIKKHYKKRSFIIISVEKGYLNKEQNNKRTKKLKDLLSKTVEMLKPQINAKWEEAKNEITKNYSNTNESVLDEAMIYDPKNDEFKFVSYTKSSKGEGKKYSHNKVVNKSDFENTVIKAFGPLSFIQTKGGYTETNGDVLKPNDVPTESSVIILGNASINDESELSNKAIKKVMDLEAKHLKTIAKYIGNKSDQECVLFCSYTGEAYYMTTTKYHAEWDDQDHDPTEPDAPLGKLSAKQDAQYWTRIKNKKFAFEV